MTDATLVALYDDVATARQALADVVAAGRYHRDRFWISDPHHEAGQANTLDPRLQGLRRDFATPSRRVQALTSLGVPEDEAHVYAEGVRRGGTLLIGELPESEAHTVQDIIERHRPADIDTRRERYRSAGWANYKGDQDYTPEQAEQERIPLAEEQVQVGKAEHKDRVRVRTFTRTQPVDKDVNLHQEKVVVERRPVSGERQAAAGPAFEEHTEEFVERNEEPVVNKDSRVREELVVRKENADRRETVHDTARRTEAEVDRDRKGPTET